MSLRPVASHRPKRSIRVGSMPLTSGGLLAIALGHFTSISPATSGVIDGVEVGHHTDLRRPTGCTVMLARRGAVGGCDVRGAAPGTCIRLGICDPRTRRH